MKVVGQTLTWAELGDELLQHVFTAERVGPLLARTLPGEIRLRQVIPGGEANITVTVRAPRLLRPLPDVLRVDLPIGIVIDGEVLRVLEADARLQVMVSLFLRVEPRWPLLVFLNVRPVQPAEVAISQEEASAVFELAQDMGQIPDLRVLVADAVNAEIEKTIAHRTVNVLAMIDAAVPEGAGVNDPEPAIAPVLPPEHVPSDGWTHVDPADIAATLGTG